MPCVPCDRQIINVSVSTRYAKPLRCSHITREIPLMLGTWCCFHAADSGDRYVTKIVIAAGNSPAQNIARQPHAGKIKRAATAANKYPNGYPPCSNPESKPRQRVGALSKVSEAPAPQNPPMPIPHNNRKIRHIG